MENKNLFNTPEFTIEINQPGRQEDMLSVIDARALTKNADDLAHRPETTADLPLSDPQEHLGPTDDEPDG